MRYAPPRPARVCGGVAPAELVALHEQLAAAQNVGAPLPVVLHPPKNTVDGSPAVPLHVYTYDLAINALSQLVHLAGMPFVQGFVAAMPDAHWGKGATIGSVFASRGTVCPNAVGVDIGCGICAMPLANVTGRALTEAKLVAIQRKLKERVPTGPASHPAPLPEVDDVVTTLFQQCETSAWLKATWSERHRRQLGSLGGGNHFIELSVDERDHVWLMLHSGSRRLGLTTAEYYDRLAQKQNGSMASDLNFLMIGSPEGQNYLHDMTFCQEYAKQNRRLMLKLCMQVLQEELSSAVPSTAEMINIHHNYCTCERCRYTDPTTGILVESALWVTRKGATSAKLGELGIIPGSMGTGSYITRGKGNPESWQSCSHGAGRRLSRRRALADIPQHDFEKAMEGIVCDTVRQVKDEAPQAYKDLDKVMREQADLLEVVHKLTPLLNVKGF